MPRNFAFVCLMLVGVLLALTVSSCGRRSRIDAKTIGVLEQLRANRKIHLADALQKQIDKASADAKIAKDGHVIVGQVVIEGDEDARKVQPQMILLEEGYFAGAVGQPGKPVGFRLHGYEPVDVIPKGPPGAIEHVGIVNLTAVPKQDLAKLRGKLEVEDRAGRPDLKSVSLTVSIDTGPINTPSGGTQGLSPLTPPPVSADLAEDGAFTADGFSPTGYYLQVSAPGCVAQLQRLTFTRGATLALEPIRLEVARKINLEYAVADNGDFADATPLVKTLVGGDRWKAGVRPEQYAWDLEFQQQAGQVRCAVSYTPCEIADLGEGTFASFRSVKAANLKFQNPQGIPLKTGHVYLLNQKHWKHWILFRVVVEL